jgi:hypothetical protein
LPEEPPISLSESALSHLYKLRAEVGGEDLMLRVGVKQGGCSGMSYTMDFLKDASEVRLLWGGGALAAASGVLSARQPSHGPTPARERARRHL